MKKVAWTPTSGSSQFVTEEEETEVVGSVEDSAGDASGIPF